MLSLAKSCTNSRWRLTALILSVFGSRLCKRRCSLSWGVCVWELTHALLKDPWINTSGGRIFAFVGKQYVILIDSIIDQTPSILEVLMKLGRVKIVHYFTILFRKFMKHFLVVKPQEGNKCFIFKQYGILINLKVRIWFPQVIDLCYQEFVSSAAHLVLKPLHFWFDWLQTFRILADCIWRVLNVYNHFI